MACGVEFLGRLEYRLCTQCGSGVVAGEQCLEFSDDLLGGGFRDQLALNLERLVQERGSIFAGHAQDGGIIGCSQQEFDSQCRGSLDGAGGFLFRVAVKSRENR